MKSLPIIVLIFFFNLLAAQNNDTIIKQTAGKKSKIFCNLHTGFYHTFEGNISPQTAFEFSTGLLGYSHNISKNLKAVIIYDVTRTTNAIQVTDSTGTNFNILYFEGSKYTAFLKMAEIDWKINKSITFSVGQLLNQQYLTVQDKFWGFRYISTTFQEKYRYGMPADFGARLTFNLNDKLKYSIEAVNGEGPFQHQDDNSTFLISSNLELYPIKNLIVKLYMDRLPTSVKTQTSSDKSVFSGFIGYKNKKYMLAGEYNKVLNYKFIKDNNISGLSVYAYYSIAEKIKVLGRIDYGCFSSDIKTGKYYIFGFEYEPENKFTISLNYRYLYPEKAQQIYANFGIKF